MKKSTVDLISRLRSCDKVRVLFVCLGNICRSPAAEGVLSSIVESCGERSRWEIDSAGMGDWHIGDLPDRRMRVHAQRRGYNLTHHARQVRRTDFDSFDLIIPMDASNERALRTMAPTAEAEAKIVPMMEFNDIPQEAAAGRQCLSAATRYDYVPDPYYEGSEGFELVLDLLETTCANLATVLEPAKK